LSDQSSTDGGLGAKQERAEEGEGNQYLSLVSKDREGGEGSVKQKKKE
jgi:hypothetical protein